MKKIFSFILFFNIFSCYFSILYAQKKDTTISALYIGNNTMRGLYNFTLGAGQAYSIDPVVRYQYKRVLFEYEGGYTHHRRENLHPNMVNYRNRGFYNSIGINLLLGKKKAIALGVGFVHSASNEIFTAEYKANIFDNYQFDILRGQIQTTAWRFRFQALEKINNRLSINFGGNLILLNSFLGGNRTLPEYQNIPYTYIVGMGHFLTNNSDSNPLVPLTFNIHVNFCYRIF